VIFSLDWGSALDADQLAFLDRLAGDLGDRPGVESVLHPQIEKPRTIDALRGAERDSPLGGSSCARR
jgi:hypothetical protein